MSIFESAAQFIAKKVSVWQSKRSLAAARECLQKITHNCEAEISIDIWGVPHIYAKNQLDSYFCVGLMHAYDRLWQLDLNRRLAKGRLSEIAGQETLNADRLARCFRFEELGKNDLAQIETGNLELLQAYSDGINCFIQSLNKKPVEFFLTGTQPELWQPSDTAAIARLFSIQLSMGWMRKLTALSFENELGKQIASQLSIQQSESVPPTYRKGEFSWGSPLSKSGFHPKTGSNSWVIGGKRTKSGKPILCNDPHLPILFPAFWYESHVHCPELKITGICLPGVPYTLIGHNDKISWGITAAFTDSCAIIEHQQDNHFKSTRHQIQVKGTATAHEYVVQSSELGVIIPQDLYNLDNIIELRTAALSRKNNLDCWYHLNRVSSAEKFDACLGQMHSPPLNFTYADTLGNIGAVMTGDLPAQERTSGQEGLKSCDLPRVFNPEKGFLVHCNQQPVKGEACAPLGNIFMNGYRARRATELIQAVEQHDSESCGAIQHDMKCLPGLKLQQYYQHFDSENRYRSVVLDLFIQWDGFMHADSIGACIYEVLRVKIQNKFISDKLSQDQIDRFRGKGANDILFPVNAHLTHDLNTLLRLIDDPLSFVFGGTESESAQPPVSNSHQRTKTGLLWNALEKTTKFLKEKLGEDPSKWRWGRLNQLEISHALGKHPILRNTFNKSGIACGGNLDTLCQFAPRPEEIFGSEMVAPSYRQIIDMSDFDKSMNILPPGQSGNLLSDHANDQFYLWHNGQYKPILWSREAVKRHQKKQIILKPHVS